MDAKDFISWWKAEKDGTLRQYFDYQDDTFVVAKTAKLQLDSAQLAILRQILDRAITDTMYSILLQLDGTDFGTKPFEIRDGDGNLVFAQGDLKRLAPQLLYDGDK
jgi:hypothetical protein